MKASDKSLLDNFSNMQEEFNSSNNRTLRDVDKIFDKNIKDLLSSLQYFNDEYVVIDIRKLDKEFEELKNKLNSAKENHSEKYVKKFSKEKELLNHTMYNFFKDKLLKGSEIKRKMSADIKHSLDRICDFDIMSIDEEIDNIVYNFKVDFEMKYINNEYSKDDFNKIMRSFKHSLIGEIRDMLISSIGELQDIVSRYATKSYEIVDHYKKVKR